MPSKDPEMYDSEARLSAILEDLPVAIAMFDRSGQFVIRSGALGYVLGETIPSRDRRGLGRWQIFNADGELADPPDWPGARVLRGESNVAAMPSLYSSARGETRRLRISATPFKEASVLGGIVLLQDLDLERRGRDGLHDHLEGRFVDALFHALATIFRDTNYNEPRAARAYIGRALGIQLAPDFEPPDALTAREVEVLKRIAWGKTHKEIALELGIGLSAVHQQRRAATAKLRLNSRAEIVRYALGRRWLSEDA